MKKDDRLTDDVEPTPDSREAREPRKTRDTRHANDTESTREVRGATRERPADVEDRETARGESESRELATREHDRGELSSEAEQAEEMRRIAMSPSLQALWKAVLPHVGVMPAKPGEFPGMFKVEPVPGKSEATVYIDVPNRPYERGVPSRLDRVLALKVSLDHDYRRLGDRHYCVDCEVPDTETRH